MGYNAKWGVFSAADAGARHERERIWIKASNPYKTGLQRGFRWPAKGFFEVDHLASLRVFPQHKDDLPKPCLLGSGHGLANFVDRTKAIGDGQVPAVVKLAWETLSQ
jgi:DNA (cytosine-5)-methyltransferase 1